MFKGYLCELEIGLKGTFVNWKCQSSNYGSLETRTTVSFIFKLEMTHFTKKQIKFLSENFFF